MVERENLKELLLVFSLITSNVVNIYKIGGGFYGPLCSTAILMLIGSVYLYNYLTDSKVKKVIEQNLTLKLLDSSGKHAKFEKEECFRVKGKNVTRLIETGHRSDGAIENIYTSMGYCSDELSPKHFGYIINFVYPLEKKKHKRIFSYDIKNSFTNNQEYWVLRNQAVLPKGKARIEFPPERHPNKITARLMTDTEGIDISGQLNKIPNNSQSIYEISLQKKYAGRKILIVWDW